MGWGWGRRGYYRRPWGYRGPGFLGEVIGSTLGTAIGNAINPPEPQVIIQQPPVIVGKSDDTALAELIKYISSAPEGADVNLSLDDFHFLTDKGIVTYDANKLPYAMNRKLVVK